jgi:hypothetical protein
LGRLAFVLVMFAVVVNPDFQTRAEPLANWALSPVYARLTHQHVTEIAHAIDAQRSEAGGPGTGALSEFLVEHYGRADAARDSWGTPYFYARDMWTVRVASAGPDRTPHTPDDIASQPLTIQEY